MSAYNTLMNLTGGMQKKAEDLHMPGLSNEDIEELSKQEEARKTPSLPEEPGWFARNISDPVGDFTTRAWHGIFPTKQQKGVSTQEDYASKADDQLTALLKAYKKSDKGTVEGAEDINKSMQYLKLLNSGVAPSIGQQLIQNMRGSTLGFDHADVDNEMAQAMLNDPERMKAGLELLYQANAGTDDKILSTPALVNTFAKDFGNGNLTKALMNPKGQEWLKSQNGEQRKINAEANKKYGLDLSGLTLTNQGQVNPDDPYSTGGVASEDDDKAQQAKNWADTNNLDFSDLLTGYSGQVNPDDPHSTGGNPNFLDESDDEPQSTQPDTPWYSGALDWLKGDTSGIPNWLLAGGGTALAAWLAHKMLSGGGNSMSAQEQMMYQQMMLQQQLEEERRARIAAQSAPMRMMWEMPMGKFAAAKAMRAEDPTEGPVIPQRPTLNATSSLARLMEITHTRGLQNKDFGQRGMSSVKSAKSQAESATDPSEGDNLQKRPTLTTGSSYKRLISMLSSKGQKNTSSNGLGMNSAENL